MKRRSEFDQLSGFQAPAGGIQHFDMDSPDGVGLRVFCLGPLRAYRGKEEVEWNHASASVQKMKAMFGFLLSRRRQGARKETLIDLLWPHQRNGKRADSNLHLTVFCLRRALEPELRRGSDSSFIRYDRGRYHFRPRQPCWIDTDTFEAHHLEASICEQDGKLEEAVRHWGTAVDLYAGDLMADIHVDYIENLVHDWCLPRRRRLRDSYLMALGKLADYHYQIGALTVAMKYASEALDAESAFEPAHRVVMQCLAADGQVERAVRQFRLCVAELEDSEGRPPSRRTRHIYESLID